MEGVPTELLHKIFIKLELEERIQCTLVCRKWWRVLDECSVVNSIDIDYDKELFIRFMEMMDQFPHRTMQVEYLYLLDSIPTGFNRRTLLNTFPNLRELAVKYDNYEMESYNSQPIHIKQLTSKLKILNDGAHCEVASQLLTSNLGGKLEQLHLYFQSIRSISTRNLLDQLNSLPVLKHLTLHSLSLRINDLENIHRNIPSIRIFELHCITIIESTIPVIISPTTWMAALIIDIDYTDDVKTHIQLYQYMTYKYCNVENIKHYDRRLSNYNDNNRKRIYLNGTMDFFKAIAAKQTSVNIHDVPHGANIADVFVKMNYKLKEVSISHCQGEILEHLSIIRQPRYIQKLILNRTDLSLIHNIKSMRALKVLILELPDQNLPIVDLGDCLNACPPSLRQFKLLCYRMKVTIIAVNFIDTLDISCLEIDRILVNSIISRFLKLATLKLRGEIAENLCITFRSPFFREAMFSLSSSKPYGITFKTPNQVVPQHYIITRGGGRLVPYADLPQRHVLTVTCLTEKRLKISDWVEILPV